MDTYDGLTADSINPTRKSVVSIFMYKIRGALEKSCKTNVRSSSSSFKDHNIHHKSSFSFRSGKIWQCRPRDVGFPRLEVILEEVASRR